MVEERSADAEIQQLRQLLARNPASDRFVELSRLLLDAGRYPEAARVCENSLGFYPDMADGHMAYGKSLVAMGKLEEGLQAFERAFSLSRANTAQIVEAGHCLADFGHRQEALPYLSKAMALNAEDPLVLELQERLGDPDEADFEREETKPFQLGDPSALFAPPGGLPSAGSQSPDVPWGQEDPDWDEGEPAVVSSSVPSSPDDDDDEPPTVYDMNPLASQAAGAGASKKTQDVQGAEDLFETGDYHAESESESENEQAAGPPDTEFDSTAGLKAEVSEAFNRLAAQRPGEPPTRHATGPAPWEMEASEPVPARDEPPTMFADGSGRPSVESPLPPPTQFTTSPVGAVDPRQHASAAPSSSISYLKVFLVVIPFLIVAVAGGIYVGYRHLRSEEINNQLDQATTAIAQDTFLGYSQARELLRKALGLDDQHPRGIALLCMVSARLHDEYGPNLALRDEAQRLLQTPLSKDGSGLLERLWARFHLAQETPDEKLAGDVSRLAAARPNQARLLELQAELARRAGREEEGLGLLEKALATAPTDTRILFELADLEVHLGRTQQAQEHLVRALTVNGIHVRSLLALTQLRIQLNSDLPRAVDDIEKVLKLPQVTDRRRAEAHLLAAQLAFLSGNRTKAAAAVRAGADLLADDADYQMRLANLCLDFFQLDEAAARVKRVLELRPEEIAARILLIGTELPRGRAGVALKALDELVGQKVPAAPFLLLRGEALWRQGKTAAALNDLKTVPPEAPESLPAKALIIQAALERNDLESARREALSLVKKNPKSCWAHLAMGDYRLAKGLTRGAATSYQRAADAEWGCYLAWQRLGTMASESKQNDKAIESFSHALSINPHDPDSHFLLGKVLLANGAPEAALDSFARMVQEQPEAAEGIVGMAQALLELGQLDKALKAIRKARKMGAEDAEARHVEGRVYLANGKFHTAVQALLAANRLQEKDPEILADLGLAQLGARSITLAEKSLKESLKRRRLSRAQEGMARVQAARGKWRDAAAAYKQAAVLAARQKSPVGEVARLYMEAGRVSLKDTAAGDGRFARARQYFQAAVRTNPADPEPAFEVAATYDRAERLSQARAGYLKVLEQDPRHPKALYRLGLLEFDEGHDAKAKELLQRFLELESQGKEANEARRVLGRIK